MRRFALTAVAAFALLPMTTICAPQLRAQGIGIKLGPSFSKFNVDPASNSYKTLATFGFSIFGDFGHGPVRLRVEALGATKGSKIEDAADSTNNGKLKLTYIEVPVNALVHLGKPVYVFGGPAVAFEGGCQSVVRQGTITISSDCSNAGVVVFRRHKLDYSAVAGAGVQRTIAKRTLMLEGRYTWGLRNINAEDDGKVIKNRSFMIMLGYQSAGGRGR